MAALRPEMSFRSRNLLASQKSVKSFRGGTEQMLWALHKNPAELWRLVTVLGAGSTVETALCRNEMGEEEEIVLSATHAHDPSHDLDLDDICDMSDLHEAPLLWVLRRRWENRPRQKIYTHADNVLVSINPYDEVPGLYDMDREHEGPHLFNFVHRAWNRFEDSHFQHNQAIIVNGESGAGKTFASTLMIQYLCNLSSHQDAGVPELVHRIVASIPMLEALGNARTAMNDNSSRFGKFLMLQFNPAGGLNNAHVEDFLLEKSRVSSAVGAERNFHVFFQMCAGLDSELRALCGLAEASEFYYLNRGVMNVPHVNDGEEWQVTKHGCADLGMDVEELQPMVRTLAAILHLGNIEFEDEYEDMQEQTKMVDSSPGSPLQMAATLLDVNMEGLEFALTHRTITLYAGAETKIIPFTALQSADARDALAKSLYQNVFDWLVARTNEAFHLSEVPPGQESNFIGCLDIYGFEICAKNTLDQLCINLSNEMLQQQFVQTILVSEKERYEAEGVNWMGVRLEGSAECLQLVQAKPFGLMSLLDEQVKLGARGSDKAFLGQVDKAHLGTNPFYGKPRFDKDAFIIKHYAGDVIYTCHGMLEKNTDNLTVDLSIIMSESNSDFISAKYPRPPPGEADAQILKRKLRDTTCAKFKRQMAALLTELHDCDPHYIRCVRPNSEKNPNLFHMDLVLKQLKYFGLMDIVRIRRLGYAEQIPFEQFFEMYHKLLPEETDQDALHDDPRAGTELLVGLNLSPDEYQIGHQKLFMRLGCQAKFDQMLADLEGRYLAKQQAEFEEAERIRLLAEQRAAEEARRRFEREQAAVAKIQSEARMAARFKSFRRKKTAATSVEAGARGFFQRREYARRLAEEEERRRREAEERARREAEERARIERERIEAEERERLRLIAEEKERLRLIAEEQERLRREAEERERQRLLMEEQERLRLEAEANEAARLLLEQQEAAATRIEAMQRSHARYKSMQRKKAAAVKLESVTRGMQRHASMARKKHAATVIERYQRGQQLRSELAEQQEAAKRVETAFRRHARETSYRQKQRAAVELETQGRGFLERMHYKRERRAAITIQTAFRRFVDHSAFKWLANQNQPWKEHLDDNESVLLATVMVWHRFTALKQVGEYVASRRIVLIITTKGQILMMDAVSLMRANGNFELLRRLPDPSMIRINLNSNFLGTLDPSVNSKKRVAIVDMSKGAAHTMNFTELAGNLERWQVIKRMFLEGTYLDMRPKAIVDFNVGLGEENMPVDKTGFLRKLPFHRQRESEEESAQQTRFFILQGGTLRYFRNEADEFAKGKIDLHSKLAMISTEPGNAGSKGGSMSRVGKFRLQSPEYPKGLIMSAASFSEMSEWVAALEKIAAVPPGGFERFKRHELANFLSI